MADEERRFLHSLGRLILIAGAAVLIAAAAALFFLARTHEGVPQKAPPAAAGALDKWARQIVAPCGVPDAAAEQMLRRLRGAFVPSAFFAERFAELAAAFAELREDLARPDGPPGSKKYRTNAAAALDEGDFERAEENLQAAFDAIPEGSDPLVFADCLCQLGKASVLELHYLEAASYFKEALERAGADDASYALRADYLRREGYACYNARDFASSVAAAREALEILRASKAQDEDVAATLSQLARSHMARTAYEQAEAALREALKITRKGLGRNVDPVAILPEDGVRLLGFWVPSYPLDFTQVAPADEPKESLDPKYLKVASIFEDLALVCRATSRQTEAMEFYERSLDIRQRVLGAKHPDVAETLSDIAQVQIELDNAEGAVEPLREAIRIREGAFGMYYPPLAGDRENLARTADYVMTVTLTGGEEDFGMALKIRKRVLGDAHPELIDNLCRLADVNRRYYHRYQRAEALYKEALDVAARAGIENHPAVAETFYELARLYCEQSRWDLAEPCAKRAVDIRKKVLPADDPELALSLHDLAGIYSKERYYDRAETVFKEALAIRQKRAEAVPSDSGEAGDTMYALAVNYRMMGRREDAEAFFAKALDAQEVGYGPSSSSVAQTLFDMAGLYTSQGRYGEAEPLFQRCIKVYEGDRSEMSFTYSQALNALGWLYYEISQPERAEPLFKRALEYREEWYGKESMPVAWDLHALATIYHDMKRFDEAEALEKRCLAIKIKEFGANSGEVGTSFNSLGLVAVARKDSTKAVEYFEMSRQAYEDSKNPEDPELAFPLANLGTLYLDEGKYDLAEPPLGRALELREKGLPAGHPYISDSEHSLAKLRDKQGRFAEAEPLYRRSLEIREKVFGLHHGAPNIVRKELADMLRRMDRTAEAEEIEAAIDRVAEEAKPERLPPPAD